jgi:protein-L-isoaspartate(D-aspartate) O-methyltransferase
MADDLIGLVEELAHMGAIKEKEIKNAFLSIPRDLFFIDELRKFAFDNAAYPIDYGATISQPSTIAAMLQILDVKNGEKVLEIGSGSGYVIALLGKITKNKVYGMEIVEELANKSRILLEDLGIDAEIIHGDGKKGFPGEMGFDKILISAAAQKIPNDLFKQLKKTGLLLAPIGKETQTLTLFDRTKKILLEKSSFAFVKLQ